MKKFGSFLPTHVTFEAFVVSLFTIHDCATSKPGSKPRFTQVQEVKTVLLAGKEVQFISGVTVVFDLFVAYILVSSDSITSPFQSRDKSRSLSCLSHEIEDLHLARSRLLAWSWQLKVPVSI